MSDDLPVVMSAEQRREFLRQVEGLREDVNRIISERDHYQQVAERLGSEMAEIKASLDQVAVYEGMDGSPTALLVTELVRDHEELEARIDAALSFISGAPSFLPSERTREDLAEIARLLKGGQRVPDTIEGIES